MRNIKDNQGSFDRDQPDNPGQRQVRSEVDDRGQGLRKKDPNAATPGVPDSEVDTVDDTDKHTEATMPPGEGRDPKRNTM